MKWQQWIGISACVIIIASCFMHWTWYPDIEKYFTGFFSENNYYGKPGKLLCFFAGAGIPLYIFRKNWANRLNLIFSAIGLAYGITTFLRYSSSYDGFVPEKQVGLFVMLAASIVHLFISILNAGMREVQVPDEQGKINIDPAK